MTWFYCYIMTHWFPFLCLSSSWRETWGINSLGELRFPYFQWGAKIFRNFQINKKRQRKVFWERKDGQRKTSTSSGASGGCDIESLNKSRFIWCLFSHLSWGQNWKIPSPWFQQLFIYHPRLINGGLGNKESECVTGMSTGKRKWVLSNATS